MEGVLVKANLPDRAQEDLKPQILIDGKLL